MAEVYNETPSPGLTDTPEAQETTIGMEKDVRKDPHSQGSSVATLEPFVPSGKKSLGHQGVTHAGGIDAHQRVLYCTNLDTVVDYEILYEEMKGFGNIERIKLSLDTSGKSFDAYVTFSDSSDALRAVRDVKQNPKVKCKLMNVRNVRNGVSDFIPSKLGLVKEAVKPRVPPPPMWFVAELKDNVNRYVAIRNLQRKVGAFAEGNVKNYGKNLLIKAGDRSQAMMLSKFKPQSGGDIQSITPHKYFNTVKGIIFSSDLCEFDEPEILALCPETVYEVKKLGGVNDVILLFFNCPLPHDIRIDHTRIKVKKFRAKPTQCHICFEYGHVKKYCPNKDSEKCKVCSSVNLCGEACEKEEFCFHCDGNHSPVSRKCPRYRFEEDVVETANNEHISIGSAKRIVMAANSSENSSYASAIKRIKEH